MVVFAIVACLDPAQSWRTAAANSRNAAFLFSFGKNFPEFREFVAAVSQLSSRCRHATIAKTTISKNFRLTVIEVNKN